MTLGALSASHLAARMAMYAELYLLHDSMLREREKESATVLERQRKQQQRLSQQDHLLELPALSSFLQISDLSSASLMSLTDCDSDASTSTANADPGVAVCQKRDGFERMRRCRMALDALDQGGWKRSYHQKLFHKAYIAACARPFWKLDPPGSFARAHQKILDINNWDNLAQEILISTPRR